MVATPAALALTASVASAQTALSSDEKRIVDTLAQYHAALAAGDAAGVSRALGPTFFMADERRLSGDASLTPHLFLAGRDLDEWPADFLAEAGPYANDFEVESIRARARSPRFQDWRFLSLAPMPLSGGLALFGPWHPCPADEDRTKEPSCVCP